MILIDSSVLVAYLRGINAARSLIRAAVTAGRAGASVISRVEIESAMRSHERSRVASLFLPLRMEPVTDLVAARAGEFARQYRRSHVGIELADYLIAATADVVGAELVTLNVKHFPMFEGLRPAF